METKIIIVGEPQSEEKPKKPIEFVKSLQSNLTFCSPICSPEEYDNIEVVVKNYGESFDIFFAYDDNNRDGGTFYIGHYNDGVV